MMDPLQRQKWEGEWGTVPEVETDKRESWFICGSAPEAINVELKGGPFRRTNIIDTLLTYELTLAAAAAAADTDFRKRVL